MPMTTRRLVCAVGLLAFAAPVAAQQGAQTDPARHQTMQGVAVLSGGIGEVSREEMKQAATDYNVHLVFSNRRGEYLADVPYSITDTRKRTVASGTSDGPLLYLRLPPGRYEVSAQIGGTPVKKRVNAAAAGGAREIAVVGDES